MSKGAQKTGRKRSGTMGNLPQRKSQNLKKKQKLLIVGEGKKTEPYYFEEIRREDSVRQKFVITVKGAGGHTREDIINKAIEYQKQAARRGKEYAYNLVFCVLDVEHRAHRESLEKAKVLAGQNKIELYLSNPSFEIWLLAHFCQQSRSYENGDRAEEELNKFWQKKFTRQYKKGDDAIYRLTKPFLQTAVKNAKHTREKMHPTTICTSDCNSSTEVYRIIEKLFAKK